MSMTKRQEFYMSVKAIIEKSQLKDDAKELQDMLGKTPINLDMKKFEQDVIQIINKMQKETIAQIGVGLNAVFKELGQETIDLDKMIEMPNADMWQEMGKIAGQYYAEGLSSAVTNALKHIDLSKIVSTGAIGGKTSGASNKTSTTTNEGVNSKEISSVTALKGEIDEVTAAIRRKNDAFTKEELIVRDSVGKEIATLIHLKDTIRDINKEFGDKGLGNAINSELSSLETLVSKINTAKTDIEQLFQGIAENKESINGALDNININVNYPTTQQNDLGTVLKTIADAIEDIDDDDEEKPNEEKSKNREVQGLKAIRTEIKRIRRGLGITSKKSDAPQTPNEPIVTQPVTKDDYHGSTYFPLKLDTQSKALEKFKMQLIAADRMSGNISDRIDALQGDLKWIHNGAEFSEWSQKFHQLKLDVDSDKIFENTFWEEPNNELYKGLINLQKEAYDLELKIAGARDNLEDKRVYKAQLKQVNELIDAQKELLLYTNVDKEKSLDDMKAKHQRALERAQAERKQKDATEQARKVDELKTKYTKLAKLQSKAKNEKDLKAQSEADTLEADIEAEIKKLGLTIEQIEKLQTHLKEVRDKQDKLFEKLQEQENSEKEAAAIKKKRKAALAEIEELYKQRGQANGRFGVSGSINALEESGHLTAQIKEQKKLFNEEFSNLTLRELSNFDTSEEQAKEAAEQASLASEAEKDRLATIREIETLYKKLGELIGNQAFAVGEDKDSLDKQANKLVDDITQRESSLNFDGAAKQLWDVRTGDIMIKSRDATIETERQKRLKELQKEYKKLGELQAQVEFADGGKKPIIENKLKGQEKLIASKEKELTVTRELSEVEQDRLNSTRYDARRKERNKQSAAQEAREFKANIRKARKTARIDKMTATHTKGNTTLDSVWQLENMSTESLNKLPEVKKLRKALNDLKSVQGEMETKVKSSSDLTSKDDDKIRESISNVNKYSDAIKELIQNYEFFSGENSSSLDAVLDPNEDIQEQLIAAAKAHHDGKIKVQKYDEATQQLTYTTKDAYGAITTYTAGIRRTDDELRTVEGTTKHVDTLFEAIAKKTRDVLTYFSGSTIIYKGLEELKRGIQYVREIDSALTELKKVTDETEESYERFLDTASKIADKVGSTIAEVISSTADWAKLGYSIQEAAQLAENTSILLNVSEFNSIEDATSALVSTMQAFGYTANQSSYVVDVMNEIGNNYAVSSDGIATALQESASALASANNDYQESVAMVAAANKTTQDVSKVGGALRTIALRLRGTEVEGEDNEGLITSQSKLRSKIKSLSGVDILTDTGAYKSTYQILFEISKVWETMNDMDQAALLEIIAGKNRSNVAAGLLSNAQDLKDAYDSAMDAEGSALRENEKYLDSIQGKIDQFTNALQTMWGNTLDDEWIKGIVEIGTALLKAADSVGVFRLALIGLAVFFNKKYFHLDELFTFDVKHPLKAFKQIKQAMNDRIQGVKDLKAAEQELADAEEALNTYKGSKKSAKYKQLEENVDTAKQKVKQLTEVQKQNGNLSSAAWNKVSNAVKAFGKQLASVLTQMLVMWAITKAIELVTNWIDSWHESAEEAEDAFNNLNDELKETKNELTELETKLEEINTQIDELQNIGTLSFTDQEQLRLLEEQRKELKRQIALKEQLAKQQQQGVNSGALEQAEHYRNTGVKTGKTAGENIHNSTLTGAGLGAGAFMLFGGATAGAAIASKIGAAIGTTIAPGVGTAIGLALGALVGAVGGLVVGGVQVLSEDTVGESMDNMEEQYKKLQKEYQEAQAKYHKDPTEKNKKKFEEAQEAFTDYQSEMANYMSEMDAYYSSIDLEAETDPERIKRLRQEMNEFYDTQDKWAITSGESDAKFNALERIFGENAEQELKNVKSKAIKAIEAGKDIDIAELFSDPKAFEAFKKRMYDMGIYMTDVTEYLEDFAEERDKAFGDNSDLLDIAKKISGVTDALKGLNSAIEEINENGTLSADSLLALEEIFGDIDGVSDEWNRFVNVMMSGTSTTMEMTAATEALAEAWLDNQLAEAPMTKAQRYAAAQQLELLGVENALEYVENANKDAVLNKIAEEAYAYDEADVRKAFSAVGGDEEWSQMTSDEIQEFAEEYAEEWGLTKKISLDAAQEIANQYGVEIDNLDTIIDKLQEKNQAQEEYNKLLSEQEQYKTFATSYANINQDMETPLAEFNKLLNEYGVDSFDPSEWTALTNGINGIIYGYNSKTTGKHLTNEEYNKLNALYNQLKEHYDKLDELKKQHPEWFGEGYSLKEGVEEEFAAAVTAAQEGVNRLTDELTTTLSGKTKLELELEVTLAKTGTVLDTYTSKMETLASIQSEVAKGFVISAEKAREFAAVYPEILQGAETTANGQIQLDAKVVNAVLSGEREKLNAKIDARITELQLQNEEAASKIKFYQSQIQIAKQAAEAGTDIAWQEAQEKLTASNILLGTLINNGVDEEIAYETAAKHMSDDTTEFQKIVAGVSKNNATNMDKSAESSANSMAINAEAMQDSLIAITGQAHEAAKAVAGIASGKVAGSTEKIGGVTYGSSSTMPDFIVEEFTFDGGELSEKTTPEETPNLKELYGDLIDPTAYSSADEFIAAMEGLIVSEQQLIASNNGQIELLESYKNRPYSSYDPNNDSGLNGSEDKDGDGVKDIDQFKEDMDYWERRISAEQAKYEQVQNEIDLLEKQGKKAGANYYRMQGLIEEERLSLLEQQKDEAQEMLKTFDEGSEEWWEVANQLNTIEGNIDDVTASLQDLNDAMHNLKWDTLEELHNRFSDIISDISDIRDVLSSEDMFDDEGQWTEAGVATLGTHIDDYRWNQGAANEILNGRGKFGDDDYIPALQEFLDKEYAGNESHWKAIGIDSEQEYNDKKKELTDYYNEYIKAAKEAEKSVVEIYENQIDAVEEYTSTLVERYNDYIEVTKEALDAERDLYEFKKSTSEKTKNIADLERRIASLSGSDNAADVAERRRLQAELTDAKSDLDDHYYSHAKDQQQQALDDEASAYEEAMNNYVEGLRTTLDEATLDMTMFMEQVVALVSTNADTVEQKYHDTGLAISTDLTDPWTAAKDAMADYEGEAGLGLINKWLADGQFFDKFKTDTTSDLTSPWNAGVAAANAFDTKVGDVMGSMLGKIQSNVVTAIEELQKVYDEINKINTTTVRPKVEYTPPQNPTDKEDDKQDTIQPTEPASPAQPSKDSDNVRALQNVLNTVFQAGLTEDGLYGQATKLAVGKAQRTMKDSPYDGKYDSSTRDKMFSYIGQLIGQASKDGQDTSKYHKAKQKLPPAIYAKGTTGTTKDEWAITDEPWLGDELVLIPGKDGNLQYMRKGTGVVPADLTANLMEWGKINPNMANMSSIGTNLNMVSNAINKPELNLSFEALVKAERIDKDTLPEVKKFVQQEVNNLVRQMNYALKGVGSR